MLGAFIGLVESAIWILAVSQVIKDINDPFLIAAYAFGFAAGTLLGIHLEKFIGLGSAVVRVFSPSKSTSVAKILREEGFLVKKEDYKTKIGYSERGQVPIEFYMSEQWFMKMDELTKPAMDAVKKEKINFHPKHWSKTYNHWLSNIKYWCISRQLLLGHQIPVWYHKDDKTKIHVSINGPIDSENWVRDTDVLDTWASSWIWPIGVHKWPE